MILKKNVGNVLTIDEYLEYEKSYIDSIIQLMECNRIYKLKIVDLEKYEEFNNIYNGMILSKSEIEEVVSCVLREKMWCKLVFEDSFYVHFGYDFIMYIGANGSCDEVLNRIENNNLFVEVFESPYLGTSTL